MAGDAQHQLLEETWDKKKIFIGVIIFLLFAGGAFAAKRYLFPSQGITSGKASEQATTGVQGAETTTTTTTTDDAEQNQSKQNGNASSSLTLPTTRDVQQQIQTIQQQVTHLNIADIASSSPQVQQVIEQIQQLPKLPAEAAKAACQQLCNNL